MWQALIELNLGGADLEIADGVKLGESLLAHAGSETCKLQTLDLNGTNVGARGSIAIFEWLGANASLTTLLMANNVHPADGDGCAPFTRAAGVAALGRALQSNTTLTHLDVSWNGELDVKWEGADARHSQDPADPASAIATLCAAVKGHPALKSLHMLGAGNVVSENGGTECRDTGPLLAAAVLANTNIETFGELPIGALRAGGISGEFKLMDGRVGCAEGWVLIKLLEDAETSPGITILTLVGRDNSGNEKYNSLGRDKDACEALRAACNARSPKIKLRAHGDGRPEGFPK